jgi:uncharacterized protein (TIGR02996 family)
LTKTKGKIDVAPTGRSKCSLCGKQIRKGDQQYSGYQPGWQYHLACAAKDIPMGWDGNLARRAKSLLAKLPAAAPPPAPASLADPALVAGLRANPDDEAARKVFADALVARGDPWGEILALEQAGKRAAAAKLLKKHAAQVTGGFGLRRFTWTDGFIDEVEIDRRDPSQASSMLDDVCALPAAVLLRGLRLWLPVTDWLAKQISERAPALRKLSACLNQGSIFLGSNPAGLGKLELSRLEELEVFVEEEPRLAHSRRCSRRRRCPRCAGSRCSATRRPACTGAPRSSTRSSPRRWLAASAS